MAKKGGVYYQDVWDIINGTRSSVTRDSEGYSHVHDSVRFKGLPLYAQDEINAILESELKGRTRSYARKLGVKLDNIKDVQRRAGEVVPVILNNYRFSRPVTQAVKDAVAAAGANDGIFRTGVPYGAGVGGIMNPHTMSGIRGQDPNTSTYAVPNIWISPFEAAAIYSQKGVPETIINKKSKSILLNKVRITNPKLSAGQIDRVCEDMGKTGFMSKVVDAVTNSLTYAGSLMYPMFKNDTPLTLGLPVHVLAKYGVIGKGKLDRWVVLDRWNTVHIPNWNPTEEDFLHPKKYYVPFQGADVHGTRCARVVSAPQPGYYGTLLTMGWGISDIPGWIESVYNYYAVMSAIPTMINQMSIIVRTLELEGPLATEGMNMMDDIAWEDTVHLRETSPNNIINLDVIGKIQAVQRDFQEVPALVRLMRQDVGGRANIAEELIWSSERGAFSSGDTTDGALEKLWENNKYLHREVANQIKPAVQIQIINALGLDRGIVEALPYTTIEFDNPTITDGARKSEFLANMFKAIFDGTSAQVPMDKVMEIAAAVGDADFPVDSNILGALKELQSKLEQQADEKFDADMEEQEARIEQIKEQTKHVGDSVLGGGSGGLKAPKAKSSEPASASHSENYSRLEQRKHEKTRGLSARRQKLQKAMNKKL